MKSLLQKLSLTSLICHYKYHLTSELILHEIQHDKPKVKLSSACYIDRNLFWSAVRVYENITLLELKNIIKAERMQLPPMDGDFFWRVDELQAKRIKVTYFVIPTNVMNAIPRECGFVVPLDEPLANVEESPLAMFYARDSGVVNDDFEPVSWFDLYGFRIKRKNMQKDEKLSNRKLAIVTVALLVTTALVSSLYSVLAVSYYENEKVNNEVAVNNVLAKKQGYFDDVKSLTGFTGFLNENPNTLLRVSQLEIDPEGVFVERIRLIPGGALISGTTEKSATSLLEKIMKSEPVKEAKFSRAVTKDHKGAENFFIEVSW